MAVADAVYTLQARVVSDRKIQPTDWDGSAAEVYRASEAALHAGKQLDGIAVGATGLADFIYDTAINVQYVKLIVLGELSMLAAQIAWLLASAWHTFGASAAAVSALQALGRSFALQMAYQLAVSIASGVALQMGLDAIVQVVQLAMRTRRTWDTSLTMSAGLSGVVGGALGPAVGVAGWWATRGVAPLVSRTVARPLGTIATGAAHEYLTSGMTGVVTGQGWTGKPWDATAGATEGVLDGFRRGGGGGRIHVPDAPNVISWPDADGGGAGGNKIRPSGSGDDDAAAGGSWVGAGREPEWTMLPMTQTPAQSITVQEAPPQTYTVEVVEQRPREADEVVDPARPSGETVRGLGETPRGHGDIPRDPTDALRESDEGVGTVGDRQPGNIPGAAPRGIAPPVLPPRPSSETATGTDAPLTILVAPATATTRSTVVDATRRDGATPATTTPVTSPRGTSAAEAPRPASNADQGVVPTEAPVRRATTSRSSDGVPPATTPTTPATMTSTATGKESAWVKATGGTTGTAAAGGSAVAGAVTTEAGIPVRQASASMSIDEVLRGVNRNRSHEVHSASGSTSQVETPAKAAVRGRQGADASQTSGAVAAEDSRQPVRASRISHEDTGLVEDTQGEDVQGRGGPSRLGVKQVERRAGLRQAPDVDPVAEDGARWTRLQQEMKLSDNDVRRLIRWVKPGSRRDGGNLRQRQRALETAHLYRQVYGSRPDARPWLDSPAAGVTGDVLVLDRHKLADLYRVVKLADRRLPQVRAGKAEPLSASDLLPVLRLIVDPAADAVNADRVDQLIIGMREVRSGWLDLGRRTTLRRRRDESVSTLQRHFHRAAARPNGVDGTANRAAEQGALRQMLSAGPAAHAFAAAGPGPADAQGYRFGDEDLAALVMLRRDSVPDPRSRGFADFGAYRHLVSQVLRTDDVGPTTLASLADLVRRVRTTGAASTTEALRRAAAERDLVGELADPASTVSQHAQREGERIRDQVHGEGERVRDRLQREGERIRDRVDLEGERIRDRVDLEGERIRDQVRREGERIRDRVRREGRPTAQPRQEPEEIPATLARRMRDGADIADVPLPAYVADGMLGMVDAQLTAGSDFALVDFVTEMVSRPDVWGHAPDPADPGMRQLRHALEYRFLDFIGQQETFTVRDGNRVLEIAVRADLTDDLSPPTRRADGIRRIEKYWHGIRHQHYVKRYVRVREVRFSALAAVPGCLSIFKAGFRWVRSQPTITSTGGTSVVTHHRTRSLAGERSSTSGVFWTVELSGPVQADDRHAPDAARPHPGARLLASDSVWHKAAVSLKVPDYLVRPLADPSPSSAPDVLNLAHPELRPRVFSVEAIADTSTVLTQVGELIPQAMTVGGSALTVLRAMTERREMSAFMDQMLDTWLYSSPLFDDDSGKPLGAVRMRARLGTAKLLSQTNDSDLTMWSTAGLSTRGELGLKRTDGMGVSLGAGAFGYLGVSKNVGRLAGSAMLAVTDSRLRSRGSVLGGTGNSFQVAYSGAGTALYKVDVDFEIQPMGSTEVRRSRTQILMRMLIEDAHRLKHAERQDGTRFTYPQRSAAKPRPNATPTNLDPIQPSDYLAVSHPTTIGSSLAADITGVASFHDRLVESLHKELPDLFPRWEEATPASFTGSPARFAAVVQNLTRVAEVISATAFRGGMNSLLGNGLRLRFRRGGFFSDDYYTLVIKGELSERSYQGFTSTVRILDYTGHVEQLANTFNRTVKQTAGPELTARADLLGHAAVTATAQSHKKWSHGFSSEYGGTSQYYTLPYFPKGAEVFEFAIKYSASLEHYSRPCAWRRTAVTWPLTGGWQLTESRARPLVDEPATGTVTLWTPSTRAWAPARDQTQVAPRSPVEPDVRTISPEVAREHLAALRPLELTRAYHLEAFDHAPNLLLNHVQQLLSEVSDGTPMMTVTGAPVGQALADRLSAETLKGHATSLTGPGGFRVMGPIGDGTFGDWYWSAQVRARPENWQVVDVIDNMSLEEYHIGGSRSSVTEFTSRGFDIVAGLGVGGTGRVNGRMPSGLLNVRWKAVDRESAAHRGVEIVGSHERDRVGVGRYVVLRADLAYSVLVQARWRNLAVDSMPRSMRPAMRDAARQMTVPGGMYVVMHENDAREVGLLPGDPPIPVRSPVEWAAPDYLSRAFGVSLLENRHDVTEVLDRFRAQLPDKVRNLLPVNLVDDLMGGLSHLLTLTTAHGISGLIDNLFDGGVPITLNRRGGRGVVSAPALLRTELAGTPRFVDLRGDAEIESYRQGARRDSRVTSTIRSSDLTVSLAGYDGQNLDDTTTRIMPRTALSSAVSEEASAMTTQVERIDNISTPMGPMIRFEVPVRFVLSIVGPGPSVAPVSSEPVNLLLRIPEMLATPAPTPAPATKTSMSLRPAVVRVLDDEQATDGKIVEWKNDSKFLRLPVHFGVNLVWGTEVVREAAEAAVGEVADQSRMKRAELRSQLWSGISNSVLAGGAFMINNVSDRTPAGATPELRVDHIDQIGMVLPLGPVPGSVGWRKVDLRLMSNLGAPTLVGAASETGEVLRMEQRRRFEFTVNSAHDTQDGTDLMVEVGPAFGDGPTGSHGSGGAEGSSWTHVDADAAAISHTSDSRLLHRHLMRTYLFKSDVFYRVLAKSDDRSAIVEARVPDGMYFWLTEKDAVDLGLFDSEVTATFRPTLDAMGAAAAGWKTAAAAADGAAGVFGMEYRALHAHQETERKRWEAVAAERDTTERRLTELRSTMASDATQVKAAGWDQLTGAWERVTGYVDRMASARLDFEVAVLGLKLVQSRLEEARLSLTTATARLRDKQAALAEHGHGHGHGHGGPDEPTTSASSSATPDPTETSIDEVRVATETCRQASAAWKAQTDSLATRLEKLTQIRDDVERIAAAEEALVVEGTRPPIDNASASASTVAWHILAERVERVLDVMRDWRQVLANVSTAAQALAEARTARDDAQAALDERTRALADRRRDVQQMIRAGGHPPATKDR